MTPSSPTRFLRTHTPRLLAAPEDSGVFVLADRERISQVLTNDMTNALRYSPPDQPVRIGMTVEGETACVWVRTGDRASLRKRSKRSGSLFTR